MTAMLSVRPHRLIASSAVFIILGRGCLQPGVLRHRKLRDRSLHLLSQLLNEDEAANEDVGIRNVLLELLIVLPVPELLQQVPDHLEAHLKHATVRDGASLMAEMLKKKVNRDCTLDHCMTLQVTIPSASYGDAKSS